MESANCTAENNLEDNLYGINKNGLKRSIIRPKLLKSSELQLTQNRSRRKTKRKVSLLFY